jgi:hypothetical protein
MTTRRATSILLWLVAGVSAVVSAYGWLVWLMIGHSSRAGLRLGVFTGLIAAVSAIAASRLGKPSDVAHSRHGS